jgi:hypothetical protein
MTTVKDSQPAPSYDNDRDADSGVDYDYALDSWHDTNPEEYTSATHWWSNTKPIRAYQAGSRQAVGNIPTNAGLSSKGTPMVIDGIFGFTATEVFNPEITERYALRSLLNYYVDANTGDTRLGGLVLTRTGNVFSAKCVRNDWTTNRCPSPVLSIDLTDPSRELMEDFTLSVIRHGNNHAAFWFTKRSTFYKVHHEDCDLYCDPNSAACDLQAGFDRKIALLASMLNTSSLHTTERLSHV